MNKGPMQGHRRTAVTVPPAAPAPPGSSGGGARGATQTELRHPESLGESKTRRLHLGQAGKRQGESRDNQCRTARARAEEPSAAGKTGVYV